MCPPPQCACLGPKVAIGRACAVGGHIKTLPGRGCVDIPRAAVCAAAMAAAIACIPAYGEAHAQTEQVPPWVKQVFAYYVGGQITESELLDTVGYLIEKGVIKVDCACDADRAAPSIIGMEERKATIKTWLAVLDSGAANMEDYAAMSEADSEYIEEVVDENAEMLKEIERAAAYAAESANAAEMAAELGLPAEAAEEAEWVEYYADYAEIGSDMFVDFSSTLDADIERMAWQIGIQKTSLGRMAENLEILRPYEAAYGVEFIEDFDKQVKRLDDAIERVEAGIERLEASAERAAEQAERAGQAERAVALATERAERAVALAIAEYG